MQVRFPDASRDFSPRVNFQFLVTGVNEGLLVDFPMSVWYVCRVSYYEISVDDGPREKQKSSGITICTGTGSSSWHFHINYLPAESVRNILKIG